MYYSFLREVYPQNRAQVPDTVCYYYTIHRTVVIVWGEIQYCATEILLPCILLYSKLANSVGQCTVLVE